MTKPNDAAIGCMARAQHIVDNVLTKTVPEMTETLSRVLSALMAHDLIATLRAVEEFNDKATAVGNEMNQAGRAMRAIRDVDPEYDEAHREGMNQIEYDSNARKYLDATKHEKVTKDMAEMEAHVNGKCTDPGCGVKGIYDAIKRELARRASTAAGSN